MENAFNPDLYKFTLNNFVTIGDESIYIYSFPYARLIFADVTYLYHAYTTCKENKKVAWCSS